jgi:hypothetical protein
VIAQRISERMQQAAGEQGGVDPEVASRIAGTSAAAAAQAQVQAARLRAAATAVVPAAPAVSIDADELEALGTGMPLPPNLLQRLADQALEDLSKQD